MKQLSWLNGWWRQAAARAPSPRPKALDREAEHRWENEGGNPPLTEPPDPKPRQHF